MLAVAIVMLGITVVDRQPDGAAGMLEAMLGHAPAAAAAAPATRP